MVSGYLYLGWQFDVAGEGREGGEEESRVVIQMVSTITSTGTHHLIWQGRGGEGRRRRAEWWHRLSVQLPLLGLIIWYGRGGEGGEEESRVVTQMVSTTTSTGTHHLIFMSGNFDTGWLAGAVEVIFFRFSFFFVASPFPYSFFSFPLTFPAPFPLLSVSLQTLSIVFVYFHFHPFLIHLFLLFCSLDSNSEWPIVRSYAHACASNIAVLFCSVHPQSPDICTASRAHKRHDTWPRDHNEDNGEWLVCFLLFL